MVLCWSWKGEIVPRRYTHYRTIIISIISSSIAHYPRTITYTSNITSITANPYVPVSQILTGHVHMCAQTYTNARTHVRTYAHKHPQIRTQTCIHSCSAGRRAAAQGPFPSSPRLRARGLPP